MRIFPLQRRENEIATSARSIVSIDGVGSVAATAAGGGGSSIVTIGTVGSDRFRCYRGCRRWQSSGYYSDLCHGVWCMMYDMMHGVMVEFNL